MPNDFDQWSTAKPLMSGFQAWAPEEDRQRIAAYALYEQIYWNVPESFKLMQRGSDAQPIYVPAGRVIVETLNRYLAPSMQVMPDPAFGDPTQQALAVQVWTDLVRRERVYSKFNANKRYGVMRGDWAWQILAEPSKEAGSRVSIMPIDPASLFPIYNPDTLDIIGWHVVDQIRDDDGKYRISRLTYRKATGVGGPSPITMSHIIFETDAWGGPGMEEKAVRTVTNEFTLPNPIDDLPIYIIPNFDEPGATWGSSEMRGLETLLAAVNQSISDEELTLAMDGLGVYSTNAGAPQDPDTGEDLPWNLGPAKVVEVPAEAFFNRISGVGSVQPYQDHLKYLHEQLDLGSSTPAVAKGIVDVSVAESGVARIMQFAPIIAKATEKENVITDVFTNLLFNVPKWLVAYEGSIMNSLMEVTRWMPVYGDKIPPNKKEQFDEILALQAQGLIPNEVAWGMLRKIGYELPEDTEMAEALLNQQSNAAKIEADALGNRLDQEIQDGGPAPEDQ